MIPLLLGPWRGQVQSQEVEWWLQGLGGRGVGVSV